MTRLRGCRKSWLALLALCAGMSLAGSASAQPVDEQLRNTARHLALEGHKAYEAGAYEQALDLFQRAYEIVHAPTIYIRAARSLVKLGRFIEAAEIYEVIRRGTLEEDAPSAYAEAIENATSELAELRPRIPTLNLSVVGPGADDPELRVSLDGKPVPVAVLGVNQTLDPRVYKAVAQLPGQPASVKNITLLEGQAHFVELKLGRPMDAGGDAAPEPADDGSNQRSWGIVTGGAGLAFFVLGGISGGVALDKQSTLDDQCDPACPAVLQSDVDTFSTTRTISYIGFGAATVLLAAGVVIYLTAPDEAEPVNALLRLDPWVGPQVGGASVVGRF